MKLIKIILASSIRFSGRQCPFLFPCPINLFPLQIMLVMDPPAQNTVDVKKK